MHFACIVILPKRYEYLFDDPNNIDQDKVEKVIDQLIGRYGENIRVVEYPEHCYCSDEKRNHCKECNGTGYYMTTRNPISYYDYWRIGGRYDGIIKGIEIPSEDNGFNFSDNHTRVINNYTKVSNITEAFYGIVEPNGTMILNDYIDDDWEGLFYSILDQYKDHIAVCIDCHM